MVEYSADFYILKPVDLGKGNGALFYELSNRGNKGILARFNNAAGSNDLDDGAARRQRLPDAARLHAALERLDERHRRRQQRADDPTAGRRESIRPDRRDGVGRTPVQRSRRQAGAADLQGDIDRQESQATLLVRARNTDEPTVIPADKWEFVDAQTVRLLPAGTAFKIGDIYQLIYKARQSAGHRHRLCGHPRYRLVRTLRHRRRRRHAQPAGGGRAARALNRTISQGNSQSGRYLRDFIYSGFNEDEAHRIVFDGSIPTVASGRTFLNYRFLAS